MLQKHLVGNCCVHSSQNKTNMTRSTVMTLWVLLTNYQSIIFTWMAMTWQIFCYFSEINTLVREAGRINKKFSIYLVFGCSRLCPKTVRHPSLPASKQMGCTECRTSIQGICAFHYFFTTCPLTTSTNFNDYPVMITLM
jgi:hypothetical protein